MNEIKSIKRSDLISAPDNPFKVTMDTEMERLIESIAETGVIAPIIARPTNNGKYEIVSGHRRKYACEYLGTVSYTHLTGFRKCRRKRFFRKQKSC